MDDRERLITELAGNPTLAHATFFSSGHKNKDAPFHRTMEEDFHSDIPKVLWLIFRGAAKSTKFEEGTALEVGFRRVRNVLILGESEIRAIERLAAIKHIIEYNEDFQAVFQCEPGLPWQDTKAVTSSGVMLQAAGRGQSLRGVKHLDARPDFILLDDVEDKESGSVATPEARKKTRSWLTGTVLPALEPGGRIRMAATPLHPEALASTLAKSETWATRVYPLLYRDEAVDGGWLSSWPDRFPVSDALNLWEHYKDIGQEEDFFQEYLCRAVDPSSQVFTEDMFLVEPRVRTYHAVYAIYDPARTTNKTSATTGKAVASWVGSKLVVWEAVARKWMPSEIVDDVFATNEKYKPVAIGIEETGLREWLLQPIRTRQVETGVVLPLRPLNAPKGKLDFIRGLQPYFRAGEVVFASEMSDLRKQLLGFPTGHIDAPNALAYMLRMRMGTPIYDDFREEMISREARIAPKTPAWLLLNTNNSITTGMIVQMQGARLVVAMDEIHEGDIGTCFPDLWANVKVNLGKVEKINILASERHFDAYSLYGLRSAVKKSGLSVARGGACDIGRDEIRGLMRRAAHGRPAFQVCPDAAWTLRALSGGYAREPDKVEPTENAYSVLMEPLEAFAAQLRNTTHNLDEQPRIAYTSDGRRYISARPVRGLQP